MTVRDNETEITQTGLVDPLFIYPRLNAGLRVKQTRLLGRNDVRGRAWRCLSTRRNTWPSRA